jgi:hypothetical protein
LTCHCPTPRFSAPPLDETTRRGIRGDHRGCGTLSSERLDPSSAQEDRKETFNVCPDPPGSAGDFRGTFRNLPPPPAADGVEHDFRWPTKRLPGFRATMLAYINCCMAVA